ncbi:uncharacterized protein LOC123524714 [Mercenaria mercenaria]|uniref:uncharacterized protein LOC123524714 n=1 Tax=Mercenaria mercenaria TaxID=6596 RepID=UPI00234F1B8A|nr:uncharacterized protein LOC123524714 [Mercenaria mercenaria]
MFLSKEHTWTQHLSKDQYIGRTKIIKDPLVRQSQNWLSGKFAEYDYTNDAIFESFRDYPRKKQLYRKHKDIAKDYERKVKFYKSCQRWYSTESKRQMQEVEERFSKLLKYTFDSNRTKTKGLQNTYSKWISIHGKPSDLDKPVEQTITPHISKMSLHEDKVDSPAPTVSRAERLHSLRSVSLDNIPKVVDDHQISGVHHAGTISPAYTPGLSKSISTSDIHHGTIETTKLTKRNKHTIKLTSH